MTIRGFRLTFSIVWLLLVGGESYAQAQLPSVSACEQLAALSVDSAVISSSQWTPAGTFVPPPVPYVPDLRDRAATLADFCRVQIVATPTVDSRIGIEVWLPTQRQWNGRLLGTGNGGGAGSIAYAMGMIEGLRRGFAVANTDLGTAPDPNGALGQPLRWSDFGYRGTHEMTRVAKQLVRNFYRRDTFRSYFAGCSTGGQQALSEAQRFPDDYDGILAGAPGHNRTHVHTMFLWNFNALNATTESNLSLSQWSMVSGAVIAACAGKDGGAPRDQFLTDPRQCTFDVDSLPKCESGARNDQCLSPPQIQALRKLYAGPINPRTGERIFAPLTYGSEAQPLGPLMQADRIAWPSQQFYPFKWALGSGFDASTFDFDHDLDRVDAVLAGSLNANNPDLSAFQRRGGKLLLYTGLADPAVPFQDTVTYYERVVQARGGINQTQSFARLFLIPGMGHCFGGPGAADFGQPFSSQIPSDGRGDVLMKLVDWVERDAAPDHFLGTKHEGDQRQSREIMRRLVCAYPKVPLYVGGDAAKETSFRCEDRERGVPAIPAARYLQ